MKIQRKGVKTGELQIIEIEMGTAKIETHIKN